MKAREKRTNEKFQRVYTIILEDGIQYHPDIIEFENEDITDWNELRNQAAISAMQALLSMPDLAKVIIKKPIDEDIEPYVAKAAVGYADALIKELKGE